MDVDDRPGVLLDLRGLDLGDVDQRQLPLLLREVWALLASIDSIEDEHNEAVDDRFSIRLNDAAAERRSYSVQPDEVPTLILALEDLEPLEGILARVLDAVRTLRGSP